MSCFREVDRMPVVARSEVIAEFKRTIIVNGLPEVLGRIVGHRTGATTTIATTISLFEVDLTDLHIGTARRTAEVEEQTDCLSIDTFLQGYTLTLQDERLTTGYVIALLDEEVGITSIGELEGHLWQILIRLHDHIEIVLLLCTGSQLGVDMELSLPLI